MTPSWKKELAYSHITVGSTQEALGDLRAASERYLASLEITRRLVAETPKDTARLVSLDTILSFVGAAQEQLGLLDEAAATFTEALKVAEALAQHDGENAEWQRGFAIATSNFGRLAACRGDLETAEQSLRQSLDLLGSIKSSDHSRLRWQIQEAKIHLDLAMVLAMRQKVSRALAEVEVAREVCEKVVATEVGNRQAAVISTWARLLQGHLDSLSGRRHAASLAWSAALEQIEPLAEGSKDPELLAPFVAALWATGERDAGGAIRVRLAAGGYAGPRLAWFLQKEQVQDAVSALSACESLDQPRGAEDVGIKKDRRCFFNAHSDK